MQDGEYQLHLLIESGKQIKLEGDATVDPIIEVDFMGKTKSTNAQKDITPASEVMWDEHLFFETGKVTAKEIEAGMIVIRVKDKGFFSSKLIGYFCCSALSIYNMKDHVVHNQIIAFTNPDAEDCSKISSYVTVSINIVRGGDEAQNLAIGTDPKAKERKPWMMASVEKQYKQLCFKIIQAKNLPKMDAFGTIDAYIYLEWNKQSLQTSTVKQPDQQDFVEWFEEFLIPLELPASKDEIVFQLYDEDKIKDELVASFRLSIKMIIEEAKSKEEKGQSLDTMRWLNLYGCNPDESNPKAEDQNANIKLATTYKGSIQVEYKVIDCQHPVLKKRSLKKSEDLSTNSPDKKKELPKIEETKKDATKKTEEDKKSPLLKQKEVQGDKEPEKQEEGEEIKKESFEVIKNRLGKFKSKTYFHMSAEIIAGIQLPENYDYQIKIVLGNKFWKSEKPKVGGDNPTYNLFCYWNFKVQENFSLNCNYQNLSELPDVFIYLMKGKTPICYWRGDAEMFVDKQPKLQWEPFIIDEAIGVVKEHYKHGFFQVRLFFKVLNEIEQKKKPSEIENWAAMPKRLRYWKLRAFIYQAQGLTPSDESGASDPFIELYSIKSKKEGDNQKLKTKTCSQTNNPLYYETLQMEMEFGETLDLAPPLILTFFDRDENLILSDDINYIGRAFVNLNRIETTELDSKGEGFEIVNEVLVDKHDTIPQPKWLPVKYHFNDKWKEPGGQLLASFALIDYEQMWIHKAESLSLNKMQPSIHMPDLQIGPYEVIINVLGLRKLISPGLLPIKKSYVKFSLKSLLPPDEAKAVDDIFTTPNEGGTNPNIRTQIKFQVRLPRKDEYCPDMTCVAYDKLYFDGMNQPIIGNFSLRIGAILHELRQKDKEFEKQLAEIIKNLEITLKKKQENKSLTLQECVNDVMEAKNKSKLENIEAEISKSQIFLELADKFENQYNLKRSQQKKYEQYQKMIELEIEKQRLEVQEKMKNEGRNTKTAFEMIVEPVFEWDRRLQIDIETCIPDPKLFVAVGFNKTKEDRNKHYRKFYNKELENVREVMSESPFINEQIFKVEKSGGLFAQTDPLLNKIKMTGLFKGLIQVYNKERQEQRNQQHEVLLSKIYMLIEKLFSSQCQQGEKFEFDFEELSLAKIKQKIEKEKADPQLAQQLKQYPKNPNKIFFEAEQKFHDLLVHKLGLGELKIQEIIANYRFTQNLFERMNDNINALIRVYILNGQNFAQKDILSPSDPYLKVKCGSTTYNERENYQIDEPNPQFNKSYDFNVEFPGASVLIIEAYDFDDFFGDDFIGGTEIDLDDRFYNKEWNAVKEKPIEKRNLFHPATSIFQGQINLWLEVIPFTSKKMNSPARNIQIEPPKHFELRLVIWKTEDIEIMDLEGTSDVFVRAFFDSQNDQVTDTHWRCQDGKASFNWLLLIPIQTNQKSYKLSIQAWDKDVIASNDLIGEYVLDLAPLFRDVHLTEKTKVMNREYWKEFMCQELKDKHDATNTDDLTWDSDEKEKEKFWIKLKREVTEEGKTEIKEAGKIQCSLRIYTEADAKKAPQGVGRSEPNNDPFRPAPEGRIKLTLNPFEMFNQLVGPAIRRKIYMMICCVFCTFACILMGPFIISNGISKGIFGR